MNYSSIHEALIEKDLNWSSAAVAIDCSPSSVMNVAARRSSSKRVALALSKLIGQPVYNVFPDQPQYLEPSPTQKRLSRVAKARELLKSA
jgi:hypothetical protein